LYCWQVGATTGISPETAASFSSGGFSNVFATPAYQAADVSGYLSNLGNTNAGLFNTVRQYIHLTHACSLMSGPSWYFARVVVVSLTFQRKASMFRLSTLDLQEQ
jgi:hypothetical protein